MLDSAREKYVTGSVAHKVMAGHELELAGKDMEVPENYDDALPVLKSLDKKPLVSVMKEYGFDMTGKEIEDIWKYYKATKPVFSDGMLSAALYLAMFDIIENKDEPYTSDSMERGNLQEGEAVEALSMFLNLEFQNTGEDQIFLSDGAIGVTPDGIQYDRFDVISCAEVKNPKDTTHMKYLCCLRNQQDMLDVCPEYYWQAQCGLAVTGAQVYHWASYHPGFHEGYRLCYVPIYPDTQRIELLKERAAAVLAEVPEIHAIINENIKNFAS